MMVVSKVSEANETLVLIARLVGLTLIFQSLEFIKIKDCISENGIWRWSEIRSDYLFLPNRILKSLDWIMTPKQFIEMMTLRFYAAIFAFLYPYFAIVFFFLFFTTFLITLRWRGSFNGGSDYLTLITLLCLCLRFIFPDLSKALLWYLTLQVLSSYFMSGLYKLKQKKWRNGSAVYGFFSSPSYKTPRFFIEKSKNSTVAFFMAWAVIIFELTFPLVLSHPYLTEFYLIAGILFHLVNYVTFGLNRFFWIWSASYPALWYCSKLI